MMRFLRFVLLCYGVILALCASMVALAWLSDKGESPIPELTQCEGVACYLGIVPEKTAFADAQHIILNNPQFDRVGTESNFASKRTPPYNQVQLSQIYIGRTSAHADFVDKVALAGFEKSQVLAGDIIRAFGQPCGVSLGQADTLSLIYPGKVIVFATSASDPDTFSPFLAPTGINIFNNRVTSCDSFRSRDFTRVWHGFGTYD